jgi:hypothetical protein
MHEAWREHEELNLPFLSHGSKAGCYRN